MPRIRTVKPEFWTSDQVLECSRNARLLFLGLWNFCDDEGRHAWKPRQCKAEVFPGDDDLSVADVEAMMEELEGHGLICRYTDPDDVSACYFYVTGWHHQRIDKPQPAKHPSPFQDHSGNDTGTLPPDRKGKERKGKDSGAGAPAKRSKIDPNMKPDERMSQNALAYWSRKGYPELNLDDEWSQFVAHHKAKGTLMDSWPDAWQTWYVNAVKFSRSAPQKSLGAAI